MLPPADKSHVCFLWFVSLVWFSGFFFEQLSPYLLALSDRLTTLEVLRDAGSSVADRRAPCEAALDVGVASNPAEVARRGGRSAGLLLLGEGVVLAGGEGGCWQLVWELLARQLATTAWRNTIDSRRQNNLGAIIALCGYPIAKMEIKDSSQISTRAPIFQQYNYIRQNALAQ